MGSSGTNLLSHDSKRAKGILNCSGVMGRADNSAIACAQSITLHDMCAEQFLSSMLTGTAVGSIVALITVDHRCITGSVITKIPEKNCR